MWSQVIHTLTRIDRRFQRQRLESRDYFPSGGLPERCSIYYIFTDLRPLAAPPYVMRLGLLEIALLAFARLSCTIAHSMIRVLVLFKGRQAFKLNTKNCIALLLQ